ncbi:HEAT repeat domain-containing protein [Phormidium nigroviride]
MSSELTDALNRILSWIEQHKPEAVSLLQPGLSDIEIEEIVKDLPIELPQEIYDLYKWRNGSEDSPAQENIAYIFNGFCFYPLEIAVKQYRQKLIKRNRSLNINSPGWIEIFFDYIGKERRGYVVIDDSQESGQVVFAYNKDGAESVFQYTSLTSMIVTIAECYETGAYSISPHKDFTGSVTNDYQKAHQIWCKYNSEIVDSLLEKLQQELTLKSLINIAADLMELKDPRTVKPLILALQKPALTMDDLGIQALAARILGELGDTKAVESLLCALHNENWMTQYWAAISLGKLKDKRATYPLIEALKDSESEVRQMAVWALGEIEDLRAAEPLIEALQDIEGGRDKACEVRKVVNEALIKLIYKFPELDDRIPF